MHKKLIILVFTVFLFSTLLPVLPAQAAPAGQPALAPRFSDGYALIDAVNQLRAANGLSPYTLNTALMISAQMHSDYQASLGTWTHEGSGGTNETQRAAAQGYGSGGSFMCDEAVGFGYQYSAQTMVDEWNEPTHAPILLSTRYLEVGGGAAVDGSGRVFYTLDVCFISGQNPAAASAGEGVTGVTQEPFYGSQTTTPNPDGSIIHVVGMGESLFSIAALYDIAFNELLNLNNLTKDSLIYPGDELKIRLAFTPTLSPEPSFTPTPVIPTATRRPTRTPTPSPQPSAVLLPTATPAPQPLVSLTGTAVLMSQGLPVFAGSLGVTGLVMVLAGALLKRRR